MMSAYPDLIENLIQWLVKLPGIGRRSAERLAFYILQAPREEVKNLAQSIWEVKKNIRFCSICNNLSQQSECNICNNPKRDKSICCVVEEPSDVTVLEKTGIFSGVYHVLLGSISPLEGKGPADIKVDSLIQRIKQNQIKEVVIATDSDIEGEATALYLSKQLKPLGVKISRIGVGIPAGSNLEFADATTLARALEGRREI